MVKNNKPGQVIEITLNDREIDELVNRLKTLQESRVHIHLDISSGEHILIHHTEDELK